MTNKFLKPDVLGTSSFDEMYVVDGRSIERVGATVSNKGHREPLSTAYRHQGA